MFSEDQGGSKSAVGSAMVNSKGNGLDKRGYHEPLGTASRFVGTVKGQFAIRASLRTTWKRWKRGLTKT